MRVTIDFSQLHSPESPAAQKEIHALLKSALSFPGYYGCNLDALFDLLCEPHEMWDISFIHCRRLWQEKALYMEQLREVFRDAAAEGAAVCAQWYTDGIPQ